MLRRSSERCFAAACFLRKRSLPLVSARTATNVCPALRASGCCCYLAWLRRHARHPCAVPHWEAQRGEKRTAATHATPPHLHTRGGTGLLLCSLRMRRVAPR